MRGARVRLAASPVMVGAVTVLVAIVTVFLAYNANNGLPFVPVYRVTVELPNAARMLPGNEVRIGGRRVGVVASTTPVTAASGDDPADGDDQAVAASLELKLDQVAQPLPKDSTFRVRYRSAFGLKYLEVVRGAGADAPEGYAFSDPDPLRTDPAPDTAEVIEQTEFDDINNTFDEPTRRNFEVAFGEFANGVAGRGASLNGALRSARPLLRYLLPVARTLAAPQTRLGRFVDELADTSRILAPVAGEQAELFANAATTFAAMSADPGAFRETISEGVPTLETGIRLLPAQQRFLAKAADLTEDLLPGTLALERALPALNDAQETGTPVLLDVPPVGAELEAALRELEQLVDEGTTEVTLTRLRDLIADVKPTAQFVAPAQTVCNYWNYFFTYVPGTIAEEDQVGFSVRQRAMLTPLGDQTVAAGPAKVTIPGEAVSSMGSYAGTGAGAIAGAFPNPGDAGLFKPYDLPILHFNAYGPAGQRNADCQAGQAGYTLGESLSPGQSPSSAAVFTPDLPGSRGPTTAFFNRNGERVLRDTRVEARAP